MTYEKIKKEIKKYSSKEYAKKLQRFFKTGKGEYDEGDVFVGVRVLNLRKIAKFTLWNCEKNISSGQFFELSFSELEKLISLKIHEERLLALLILVQNYKNLQASRMGAKKLPPGEVVKRKKKILKFYLKNRKFVNNWDLVDISAHSILGEGILEGLEKKEILEKFAKSKNLWERRIAIISTFAFIRQGKFQETLKLAKILLDDKEDLIHKAVGWMLREVWKKDGKGVQKCEAFLRQNYKKIPRTTLRYAIEKMHEEKRQKFLKGEFRK